MFRSPTVYLPSQVWATALIQALIVLLLGISIVPGMLVVLALAFVGVPGSQYAGHDALRALMKWVEYGVAPNKTFATKYKIMQWKTGLAATIVVHVSWPGGFPWG